ncbi:hypothetical protein D9M72_642330 [compost metagenome]
MDLVETLQCLCRICQRRRDELQQRLGIVGGDLFMGQRRAQGFRVRGLRQPGFTGNAQAFTLNTMQALLEQRKVGSLAQQGQAAVEKFAQDGFLHASVAPIWG